MDVLKVEGFAGRHRAHPPAPPGQGAGRLFKLLIIGGIAFLIDAATFQASVSFTGMSVYAARAVSFFVATTAAWWLNRKFTFREAPSTRPEHQWARFMAANLVGGSVNYAVFALLLMILPLARTYPVLAVAAGSLAGFVFNWALYTRFVFCPQEPPA